MIRLNSKFRQSRAWFLPVLLFSFFFSYLFASQASAETRDHNQEYGDALDTVMVAEANLAEQMILISNGTVAHYDFLQHQHIELLRHARALRHPPLAMSASERDAVIARADTLLAAAKSLELVIADYLRAQAQMSSALSNTLDLIATRIAQTPASPDNIQLQVLADAANDIGRDNTAETREALYVAFDKVATLDFEQAWLREISMQGSLIRRNASDAASGPSQLAMAGITQLAEELRIKYVAAMGK